jgi:hypothetical protein
MKFIAVASESLAIQGAIKYPSQAGSHLMSSGITLG